MTRALLVVAAAGLFRLAFVPAFELLPQEAYYLFYARHLALSYFDHPPAIAVLLRAATSLLGWREIAPRLCAFVLAGLTQWAFWKLAGYFLPSARRLRALLLFCTAGFTTVLALISTPDVPLLLFWTLALLQFCRAIFDGRKSAWLAAGLFMGLAFDSKYSGAMLQLGLVLFLLASPKHRALLRTPWPWLALAVAHLVASPVYVWNAQHGFASFLFQTRGRAAAGWHFGARHLLALAGTQALLLGPFVLGVLAVAVAGRPRTPRQTFLFAFTVPIFALCAFLSLGTLVKPNWMLPCYVTGVLLVARVASTTWVRRSLAFAAALHLAAAAEVLAYPVPIRSDDTWFGWRALAAEARRLAAENPGAFLFSTDGYKTTAELLFYLEEPVYGPNVVGERGLAFEYAGDDLAALRGRDAIWLDSSPGDLTPGRAGRVPDGADHFESCEELDPILLPRRSEIVRKFFVFRCARYRGP